MKKILLVLLSFYTLHAVAQNEYMRWGINDYEIDFCNDPSCVGTSLNHIDKSPSKLIGSASMCDRNTGNLLFYTDGMQVFNAALEPMPNGQNLGGSYSTQAALIVPQPGSNHIYYIFTTVRWGIPGGLSYSIVDMNLNHGLGDVTVKHQLIDSITDEKLTAVYNADEKLFWVIAHDPFTGNFLAFKLDSKGFNPTRVESPSHVNITNMYQTAGYIKASPNGQNVAAVWEDPPVFNLYNFNKTTGQLTLHSTLPVEPQDDYVFGASFSPDNSKLYVSAGNDTINYSLVYQYDLSNTDSNSIKSSRTSLGSVTYDHPLLGMQLGPDQRLYIVRDSLDSISVIDNPNLKGAACNFKLNKLSVPAYNVSAGLSNNIDGLYYYSSPSDLQLNYSNNISCDRNVNFEVDAQKHYDYFNVDFGDGTPLQQFDGSQTNFTHQYATTGNYTVKLLTAIGSVNDSAASTFDVISVGCNTEPPLSFYIPTLLTPNANGFGSTFVIPNIPANTGLEIYDEYGRLVFKSPNYQGDWNIASATPQMYFYVLTTADGNQYKGKVEVVKIF